MQRNADIYLLQSHSFSGVTAPIIRRTKIVTAASVTDHNIGTATSLHRGLIRPQWREVTLPVL